MEMEEPAFDLTGTNIPPADPPVQDDNQTSLELFSDEPAGQPAPNLDSGPVRQPNMAEIQRDRMMKLKNIVSFNKIKSNQNLRDMEDEPAYVRKNVEFGEVQHSEESNLSKFNLEDNYKGEPEIRENNSFLHDNVD